MATYDLPCAGCGQLMWRVAKSAPAGVARCRPCRRVARGAADRHPSSTRLRPCSKCGDPRPVGRTSRVDVICLPCRRAARGLAPDVLIKTLLQQPKQRGDCHHCGQRVLAARRWKFCSDHCFEQARVAKGHGFPRAKSSPEARGYGAEHRALREKLLPLAYGKDCPLCGDAMEEGQKLHLDHNEDRTGYRGMVHGTCNLRDGARRGRERQRQMALKEGWRPGQDPDTRRRPTRKAA